MYRKQHYAVHEIQLILECVPMPNVMAALLNIGGALCSRRKVWLTPTTTVPRSNGAKTQKPVEICRGAPNSRIDLSH